ncbi:hypothetical protein HY992_00580 [Candidatus Micrarchaeota archaeon]|nr:hypothetical protein [Candidatus Micrarchaeota archaeon]
MNPTRQPVRRQTGDNMQTASRLVQDMDKRGFRSQRMLEDAREAAKAVREGNLHPLTALFHVLIRAACNSNTAPADRVKAVQLLGDYHAKIVEDELRALRTEEARKKNNALVYAIDAALEKMA